MAKVKVGKCVCLAGQVGSPDNKGHLVSEAQLHFLGTISKMALKTASPWVLCYRFPAGLEYQVEFH